MLSAAQLLDELMGRDRNLAPDEKRSNVRWDHETVSEPLNMLFSMTLAALVGEIVTPVNTFFQCIMPLL